METKNHQVQEELAASDSDLQAVWLVGASSGIGRALAEKLSHKSQLVFISARSEEDLVALSEKHLGRLIPVPLDVVDDWSVNAALQKISQYTGKIDQVIINAGTCEYIDSYDVDIDTVRKVMETNFFGALNVVNQSLPFLRQSRAQDNSPQLVFVSSSVTFQALPRAGAYGSSKAALRYFAECLRIDLQHEGIDVRVVSPGFVDTPLTAKNDFSMPFKLSASDAADRILAGLSGNRFDVHFPKRFTFSLKLLSWLPASLRFRLLGKTSRHDPSYLKNKHHPAL